MSVPARRLVDKEGRNILKGDTKVVEPMFYATGSGESFLTKDSEGHGLVNLQGYGWYGGVHLAGDVVILTIPLDIKLKDITSVGWLEKCKTAEIYNYTMNVLFQIDLDENGIYTETSDDRFLFAMWQDTYGHTSWTKVDALATEDTHESVDHFKLYDGAWTKKATPDGTITADTADSFADFQATDLGEYRVKAVQIVYSGEKTGTADYWVQAANFEINGIFHELKPKAGQVFTKRATGALALALTLAPKAPFRLLNVMLHCDSAPDTTSQAFTVTCDAGDAADVYDFLLYSNDLKVTGTGDLVATFGKGYEFKANDEIDIAYTNTDTVTYGVRATYEVL